MADLVTPSSVLAFLSLLVDDGTLTDLANGVEAKLEADCGRTDRPFSPAQPARAERKDGNGRTELYVDYPIAALTSIKLGYNQASPDETLDVADPEVVQWEVGKRRIVRVDGGTFGATAQARYVGVVYDAAADLPADCGLTVLRGVAILFGQRGSEDVKAESVGGYRADLAALDTDPLWVQCVERHREIHL